MSEFSCQACGSPAIALPVTLSDEALVHCDGCGLAFGSWSALKLMALRALVAQGGIVSPDPLPLPVSVKPSNPLGFSHGHQAAVEVLDSKSQAFAQQHGLRPGYSHSTFPNGTSSFCSR